MSRYLSSKVQETNRFLVFRYFIQGYSSWIIQRWISHMINQWNREAKFLISILKHRTSTRGNDVSTNRWYCGLMYARRIININVNKKRASLRDIFIFGNPLTGHRRSYWSEFTAWHLKYDVRHAKRINTVKFRWSKKRLIHVSRELYIQTSCALLCIRRLCILVQNVCFQPIVSSNSERLSTLMSKVTTIFTDGRCCFYMRALQRYNQRMSAINRQRDRSRCNWKRNPARGPLWSRKSF